MCVGYYACGCYLPLPPFLSLLLPSLSSSLSLSLSLSSGGQWVNGASWLAESHQDTYWDASHWFRQCHCYFHSPWGRVSGCMVNHPGHYNVYAQWVRNLVEILGNEHCQGCQNAHRRFIYDRIYLYAVHVVVHFTVVDSFMHKMYGVH